MFMAIGDAIKAPSSVATVADDFPIAVLPPTVRQMVEELAHVAAVPCALPACQALGIMSAALGAGLAIPSDREPTTFGNLYIIAAAESGTGKSLVFKPLMQPVFEHQEGLRAKTQSVHYALKAQLLLLKGTLKRVEAGKELFITDDMIAGLIKRKEEIETALKRRPKTVCEDVTREKLQVLLAQNDERIFSASADARQVIHAVLNGKGENPYIKSWSGDPVDVDRISRDAVPLKAPRMALLWCPQPDLMLEMFAKRILTDSGFLPRCLPFMVECRPMPVGQRTRRVRRQTQKRWHDLVLGLYETYFAKTSDPYILKPSKLVQPVMVDYYNDIIQRRGSDLADISPYASRWAEEAWRLLVVLHAAKHGPKAHEKCVLLSTANDAIRLMECFSRQQLDLLRQTRAHARTEVEHTVFQMVAAKNEITVREAQLGPMRSYRADEVRLVLDQLVGAGKLDCRAAKPERGGHEKKVYFYPLRHS
jgi:hypothetical protein